MSLSEWGLEPTFEPPQVSGERHRPAVDPPNVALARDELEAAQQAAVAAHARLEETRDALADAEGVVTVADAKCDDFAADPKKAEWQRIAAHEALAKAQRRRDRAEAKVEEREQTWHAADQVQAAAELALTKARTRPVAAAEELESEDKLYFSSVDEFVEKFLVPTYRRRIDGGRANGNTSFRWEGEWWKHPEALVRLEALWRAFEHLRRDPALGMSVWLRDHADHHLPILMSNFGPFRRSEDKVDDGAPLPYVAPPEGLFADVRSAAFPD